MQLIRNDAVGGPWGSTGLTQVPTAVLQRCHKTDGRKTACGVDVCRGTVIAVFPLARLGRRGRGEHRDGC